MTALTRTLSALALTSVSAALVAVDVTHGGFVASVGGALLDYVTANPLPVVRFLGTALGLSCAACSLLALAPGKLSERVTCLGLGALGVGLVACVQCLGV